MDSAVLVALISGAMTLLGTIITVLSSAASNRKKTEKRVDELERQQKTQYDQLKEDIKATNERIEANDITTRRQRITRFATEVRRGDEFPKEDWDSVKIDCDVYEEYGESHPKFPNGVCNAAIRFLNRRYDELMETDGFLKV